MNKVCKICKEERDIEFFNKRTKSKDGYDSRCKECTRKRDKKRYIENIEIFKAKAIERSKVKRLKNRNFIWNYLKKHPCIDCGEQNPIVLEFDHVRGEKLFNVGDLMLFKNLDILSNEIDKCDIRCANCHKKKTAIQFNWYKDILEK